MKKEVVSICVMCEFSSPSNDEEYVICDIKGKVPSSDTCRKFIYDLTKHDPKKPMNLNLEFPAIDD